MVVQATDIFICEPSNHTVLPTAKTITTLESGEHLEAIDGMYSRGICFHWNMVILYLICKSEPLVVYCFISGALN
jgi:hypothetical protein